jgi:rod shape determining protein RodA
MISQDNFSRLFCGAFAISLFLQISINIGMNLGLLPVVGIPLPFLSYGGSNLAINYLCLGILQNILKKSSIFSEKEV